MSQFERDWYDPRKQLPAIYGEYLIIRRYTGIFSRQYAFEVVFYDDVDTWWGNENSYSNEEVLAWCELPTFPQFLEDNK